MARCRNGSGNAAVSLRSKDSSTRLSLVFTPWPPGPLDRENRQRSSPAGTVTRGEITRSFTASGMGPIIRWRRKPARGPLRPSD